MPKNPPVKNQTVIFLLAASLFLLALFPAHLAASELTLAWNSNAEDDLAGYRVYYGTRSRDYDFVIDIGNITHYTVTCLESETRYYFALTAYDTSENESDYSAEVSAVTGPPHRMISGLGETSGGRIEAFAEDYSHMDWVFVGWTNYNSVHGEARTATGDIDGDGRDEIVVGLAPVSGKPSIPGGWFQVLEDDYKHLAWGQIDWTEYNNVNGETRPACGDIDGDGKDEIIIGLGPHPTCGGWLQIFDFISGRIVHKAWIRLNLTDYNGANGETRPACGDIDGDGKDEIIIGLGQGGGGYLEILDDASAGYVHLNWARIPWESYNSINGASRPACGDVDGDGKDEIIIGLDPGGDGWFELVDDDYTHLTWGRVGSADYNSTNGETRPACGDIDGDGRDEIVIGLGQGGGGWMQVFDDASAGYAGLAWPRVDLESYCSANGETWPALKK